MFVLMVQVKGCTVATGTVDRGRSEEIDLDTGARDCARYLNGMVALEQALRKE